MPKIIREKAEIYDRQVYPGATRSRTDGYCRLRLSEAGGLTQFGAGEVTLQPGGATSLSHWHEREDEFIYVLAGELTVIEGDDIYVLHAGESATFKAGVAIAHTAENRSNAMTRFLEVGTRDPDEIAHYPSLDMVYRRALAPNPYQTLAGELIHEDETPKPRHAAQHEQD